MSREEFLNERQSEFVHSILKELKKVHRTQKKIASIAGVSQQTVSRYLADDTQPVGFRLAKSLADQGLLDWGALMAEASPPVPDSLWQKIHPVLMEHVGPKKTFEADRIAKALGVDSTDVTSWLSGVSRPTNARATRLVQILSSKPNTLPTDLLLQFFGVPHSLVARDSVSTPRYSNRERAIQLLVEDGVEQAVAEEAANRAAVALDANEDQSVLQWVEMTRPFVKAARRGDSGPGVGARELEDE